jgi:uncharacterized RDD family membrane protein YckC
MDNPELEEFKEKEPLVLGKWYMRVLAALADLFITLLLAVFLNSVPLYFAFGVYDKMNSYNAIQTSIISEGTASHLAAKGADGNFKTEAILSAEYVSYKAEDKTQDDNGYYLDILAGYAIDYKKIDIATYNVSVLGLPSSLTDANTSGLWTYPAGVMSTGEKVGVLKDEIRAPLYAYLHSLATDKTAYNKVADFFSKVYAADYDEFSNSEHYLSLFASLVSTYQTLRWDSAISAEIAFLVSALVFYVILPLFAFQGKTLGKCFLKLKVGRDDTGEPLTKKEVLIRGLLEILTVSFAFTLVPAFSLWGFGFMNLPFFALGNYTMTFGLTMVVLFIFCLGSTISMMSREDKKAFHDLPVCSSVYSTDIKLIEAAKRIRALSKKEE